jgi:hypothetical protein
MASARTHNMASARTHKKSHLIPNAILRSPAKMQVSLV